MKLNCPKFILGFIFLLFLIPKNAKAWELPPLIFSEIAWAGSSVSPADEWIELKNTTSQDIDLSNWTLTWGEDDKKSFKFPENIYKISAGSYFLISDHDAQHIYSGEESVLAIEPDSDDLPPGDFSLFNNELLLKIFDDKQNLIDQIGNGEDPFAGSKEDPKATMVRVWPPQDGSQPSSWLTQTSCFNLDSCEKDLATPGVGEVQIQNLSLSPEKLAKVSVVNLEADLIHSEDPVLISGASLNLSFWDVTQPFLLDILEGDPPFHKKIQFEGELSFQKPGEGEVKLEIEDSRSFKTIVAIPLKVYDSGKILITEILPNPQELYDDEWIELYNLEDHDVFLLGFTLLDKAGNEFVLPEKILPNQYILLFMKSKLNNSGDEIILENPLGEIVQKINYEKSFPDFAYALDENDQFVWTTTPTPGTQNKITSPPEEGEPLRPPELPKIKTGEAGGYLGQWVEIEAIVVDPQGSTFYIDDGSGSLKVYLQEKTGLKSPGLKKGYKVRVRGLIDIYRGVIRLLPRIPSDIEILEKPDTSSVSSTSTQASLSEHISTESLPIGPSTINTQSSQVVVKTIEITTSPKLEDMPAEIAPLSFDLDSEPFSPPNVHLFGLFEIFLVTSFSLVLKFSRWLI